MLTSRQSALAIPDAGNFGEPTYYVDPDHTAGSLVVTIRCVSPSIVGFDGCRGYGAPTYGINGSFHDAGIRVPLTIVQEGVAMQGSTENAYGTDKHLVVVDLKSRVEWDFWGVEDMDGGVLLTRSVDAIPLDGPGYPSITTAATFGNLAGRIRAEELIAGEINHALALTVPCTKNEYVPPATQCGMRCVTDCGMADEQFAPRMGDRLRLDMTEAEIRALTYADGSPFPDWKKTILRAMRRFGFIIGDTGGFFSDRELAFEIESGSMYSALGRPDKWVQFAQQNLQNGEWEQYQGQNDPYNSLLYVADFNRGSDRWRHRLKLIGATGHLCPSHPPRSCGTPP